MRDDSQLAKSRLAKPSDFTHWATGAVQHRKDFRRDPLKRQSRSLADTAMDSAAPRAVATGSLLRLGSPCKGLSEANPVVVRVFLSPERISLAPFPRGRAKLPIHPLRIVLGRN